ncbi:MAG: hypothetical protein O2897_00670 [bacterium]|nr:hypothetical protein [bacterium]
MKVKIEFNNRSIRNHKSNFTSAKGKPLDRVDTPFNLQSVLYKGLRLREYRGGSKHFIVIFYLKGQRTKPRVYTVGTFDDNRDIITGETIFGVKQCTDRLFKLVKEHCDERGHWIKDPNLTISFSLVNKSITVRDLIIEYAKSGFERMRSTKKLTANSIRDKVKYLFGYNIRAKHLEYDDDNKGDGVVRFVPVKTLRTKTNGIKEINRPAPTGWDELFKWYPPGKHILKDHSFNLSGRKSIFDSDIGKINIEDIRTKLILNYLSQFSSQSSKYDAMECFRTLWHFAVHQGYMENDAMINPTYLVPIKQQEPKENKYRLKVFSDLEWDTLLEVCSDLSSRFPWQADCIILQALTGLRKQEAFKLEKKDIQYFDQPKILKNSLGETQVIYGEIHIRKSVSKTNAEEWIPIIEPIKICLDNIAKIPDTEFVYTSKQFNKSHRHFPLAYAKSLKWLFCSTKVQTSKLFDSQYRYSRKTRLRSDKWCWDVIRYEMRKRLKIPFNKEFLCTSKMLRKTFTHKAKMAFGGRSDMAKRFTRHKTEAILEGVYDGTTREEVHQNATELGKVLMFNKRRA